MLWSQCKIIIFIGTHEKEEKMSLLYFLHWFVVIVVGALYIMILIMVNLIGYSVGTGGIELVQEKIFSQQGMQTLAVSLYFLSIGVHLMLFLEKIGVSRK